MSLDGNTMDRTAVERSQAEEAVTTDQKQTRRLYPSLPSSDRFEFCLPDRSVREKLPTAAARHGDSLQGDSQSDAAGSDVRMKAQILILEEQRHELLSINDKWATEYRIMGQYYKDKIRDLKASLQSRAEEEACEEGEKDVTPHEKLKLRTVKDTKTTWGGDVDIRTDLLRAEKEAEELRALNSTLTRREQHQHEEIKRLNKALQEALQSTKTPEVSSEALQDIWKHQAEVYKEDFLRERKDREKLKDKYLELEKKFRKVYSELRVLKPQVTPPARPELECTCTNRARCPPK